ncbi:hypothetical protein OESDEN_05408 [Oesophagostomum dentatum]|uniref:Uncharacterized protein n=1 Tax=Oesophagostomum dentatum TaxID=61180 RepID=A0A0B1TH15_OESDE|nr:hypothetical protein OESDEN_05408 [Oesophagostomum dentatum]
MVSHRNKHFVSVQRKCNAIIVSHGVFKPSMYEGGRPKFTVLLFAVVLIIISLSQAEAGEPQEPAGKAHSKDASEKPPTSSTPFTGKPLPPGVSGMPSGINPQI